MMKKTVILLLLACSVFCRAQGIADDDARQAVYGALDQAKTALKSAPFGNRTVAILPVPGDSAGLLSGRLKNMLTELGFVCVEGKEDPMWNEIIREIAWDERKDDILDPATLVKFGKLKAAQILLYGRIRVLDRNADRVYAEIELHATDLATRRHIWGGSFAFRFYKGGEMQGIISLDNDLRMLLKKSFEEAKKSLQSPETAGKLETVKTVSVIPLAGDIDQYMTGLAIEMLTQTRHLPKSPRIPSLSQMRAAARDGQLEGDAVFYGAVRDLRRTDPVDRPTSDKKMESSCTIHADIQLFLEDLKSGVILWSKTITLAENFRTERPMTSAELAAARQTKIDAIPDAIKEDVVDNWKQYAVIFGIILGAVVLLVLVIVGIKAFSSYHNVR